MAKVSRGLQKMISEIAEALEKQGYASGKIPRAKFVQALVDAMGTEPQGKIESLYNALQAEGGLQAADSVKKVMTGAEQYTMLAARDVADDVLEAAAGSAKRGPILELLAGAGEQRKKELGTFGSRAQKAGRLGSSPMSRVVREVASPKRVANPLTDVLRMERGRVSGATKAAARTAGRALPEAGVAAKGVEEGLLAELLNQARARFGKPRAAGETGELTQALKREAGKGFFSELKEGLRAAEVTGKKAVSGGRLGSEAVGAGAKALRGAGRFVGRHAVPLGIAVDLLFLGKMLKKGLVDEPAKAAAVEREPTATPTSVLRELRQQEQLAMRQARLMRNDPEAYNILTQLLGTGTTGPRLARGEFVVGGPPAAEVGNEEIQNLLAMMQ